MVTLVMTLVISILEKQKSPPELVGGVEDDLEAIIQLGGDGFGQEQHQDQVRVAFVDDSDPGLAGDFAVQVVSAAHFDRSLAGASSVPVFLEVYMLAFEHAQDAVDALLAMARTVGGDDGDLTAFAIDRERIEPAFADLVFGREPHRDAVGTGPLVAVLTPADGVAGGGKKQEEKEGAHADVHS